MSFWVDKAIENEDPDMPIEFLGNKTYTLQTYQGGVGRPVYKLVEVPTDEYVQWLEERLEGAHKRLRDLRRQNEHYQNRAKRQYQDQIDYLDYEDDRR